MKSLVGASLVVALGCSSEPHGFPSTRFANQLPAVAVDDRRDVIVKPEARLTLPDSYNYDSAFHRVVTRGLELPRQRRALGVNALDEVPDSTWFTNRPPLTPAQVKRGPVTIESPELHFPWKIRSTKAGGSSLGYVIKDARGIKFVLKFDSLGFPEVETGVDVIVDRLLWAAGYNVSEDQVVYFRPEQLEIPTDAEVDDSFGHGKAHFTRTRLLADLAHVEHEPDGRIRAVVSRYLDGVPLGGHPQEGVRRDDPNDVIGHELRRDLRGMYAVYAWLDAVDVVGGNFLDMYVSDPADPARHYVKHYAIDFGKSMGAMAAIGYDLRCGATYRFDWGQTFYSLVTLGLAERPWEERPFANRHGVSAVFEAVTFDPANWHPGMPYIPFDSMDDYDGFWGAKLITKLTRDQIHAAVEAARLSDPRSIEYITDTLVQRQRKTGTYWFSRVNPLDRFHIRDGLCFDDLAVTQGYAASDRTSYSVVPRDPMGNPIGRAFVVAADPSGRTCAPIDALANRRDAYTIFEITTRRPTATRGKTLIHVARDPRTSDPRVIGVWRE